MKEYGFSLPAPVRQILSALNGCGFEAYAVGGCVRDTLLSKAPNDWDVTTSATPTQVKEVFSDRRVIETGIQHGTVGVLWDGEIYEITTYRCDGEYLDNRHPSSVTFSARIEDDLSRRDFTVNAMAYSPNGGFVDLFGGEEDLARGVIRCVGEPVKRFCEDGLRILRALRFAAVLDFEIAPETAQAVRSCRDLLSGIAAERIREEFCKLICGKGAARVIHDYVDVLGICIPELLPMVGFDQNTRYHCYDVLEHTLHALDMEERGDLVARLAILFHDIGKPHCYTEDELGGHFKGHAPIGVEIVSRLMKRLRFDNDTTERVKKLVELHDLPIAAKTQAVRRLMTKLCDEDILRLLEVKRCDRLAHAEFFRALPEELPVIPKIMRELREADACLSLRDLAIDGADLLQMGMKPGRAIGALLQALFEDVMDERLENDRELLLATAEKRRAQYEDM